MDIWFELHDTRYYGTNVVISTKTKIDNLKNAFPCHAILTREVGYFNENVRINLSMQKINEIALLPSKPKDKEYYIKLTNDVQIGDILKVEISFTEEKFTCSGCRLKLVKSWQISGSDGLTGYCRNCVGKALFDKCERCGKKWTCDRSNCNV